MGSRKLTSPLYSLLPLLLSSPCCSLPPAALFPLLLSIHRASSHVWCLRGALNDLNKRARIAFPQLGGGSVTSGTVDGMPSTVQDDALFRLTNSPAQAELATQKWAGGARSGEGAKEEEEEGRLWAGSAAAEEVERSLREGVESEVELEAADEVVREVVKGIVQEVSQDEEWKKEMAAVEAVEAQMEEEMEGGDFE